MREIIRTSLELAALSVTLVFVLGTSQLPPDRWTLTANMEGMPFALEGCDADLGCAKTFDLYFQAPDLAASARIGVTWRLTLDVEGSGHAEPPPGLELALVEPAP